MAHKKLTDILTAKQHQRMIDKYSNKINAVMSDSYNDELLRKINYHTEQYLIKTGNLPS